MNRLNTSTHCLIRGTFFFLLLSSLGCESSSQEAALDEMGATPKKILIVGGGTSHDFDTWFREADSTLLAQAGYSVSYTDVPADMAGALDAVDILYLNTNQPIPDSTLWKEIFDFSEEGKGLLLVHAALWYNWEEDRPDYYQHIAGGGSRSHGPYGPFQVEITQPDHPLAEGLPVSAEVEDELYRYQLDPIGTTLNIFMEGIEPDTGDRYPVAWTVEGKNIVGITLGHDGKTHESPLYRQLLLNSAAWLTKDAD